MPDKMLVLLVEDEFLIRDLVQTVLEEADFAVLSAGHGGEAIQLLDRHEQVAALITDVRLGDGPDGWAVARHARRMNPALPIIYFSGHGAIDWASEGVPDSLYLQKPLTAPQIVKAVHKAISPA
jgi:DNA-binding NtrC family response regulator